jgi:hypothetical protein
MTDWKSGTVGKKKLIMPDGSEHIIEDLQLPEKFVEKEIKSNVRAGGIKHVPRDVREITCPSCKMSLPEYERLCAACGWQRR